MDDNTSLREKFRSKMSVLQEALDNSPYAEKKGICIPIDDVLTAILAIYYYLNRDEVEKTPDPEKKDEVDVKPEQTPNPDTGSDDGGSGTGEVDDSASSDITPYLPIDTDWSKVDWEKRMLGDSDKKSGSGKGYNPSTCRFWEPKSKENDPYELWKYVEGYEDHKADKNFTAIVEQVAEVFDYGENSYKQFNRLHFQEGDPNLTYGFAHFAGGNERELLTKIKNNKREVYEELCQFFLYRLLDPSNAYSKYYREQAANDRIISEFLFEDGRVEIDEITPQQWLGAIKYFFSEKGVLNPKNVKAFFSNPKYKDIYVSSFDAWAEEMVMLYADVGSLVPDIELKKIELKKRKIDKNNEPYGIAVTPVQVAALFQHKYNVNNDYHSYFWFYEIFREAIMLKTVAAEQIRYWWERFYENAIKSMYEEKFQMYSKDCDLKKDETFKAVISICASLKNNKLDLQGSSTVDEEKQWVKYGGKEYFLTKTQYESQKNLDNEKDKDILKNDRRMALILLLGMVYREQTGRLRSRMLYMLEKYWQKMWSVGGENIGKDLPKLEDCSKISRKRG